VTLISGPVQLPDPAGARMVKVETAREMLYAVEKALPSRCRGFRGRGRGLEYRQACHAKTKKDKAGAAATRADRKSRYPRDHRAAATPNARAW
jgi:phosphopantothenoylcysteine decarboxylase/phosphopantothenate--cysteine ligase